MALLATITLSIFLPSLHGYRSSLKEIQDLMDSELQERARLLGLSVTGSRNRESSADSNEQYAFQVFYDEELVWRSRNAPQTVITREAGFQENNFSGKRWRTYAWIDGEGRILAIAAERIDMRNLLAENIILKSVMPTVLALPLIGILIWIVVGYGLSPLRNLAAHLRARDANDLSPVPTEHKPGELMQVVHSTNELFARLRTAFERERRFASDAAHELRTPIAALKVHLHNISHLLPDNNPELVNLEDSTRRMGNLVDKILALYRTSPDVYKANFTTLDLYLLASEMIADMYPEFEARNISIELVGRRSLVSGDRPALETMLINLLDNACKYTNENGQVKVNVDGRPGGGVVMQVEDSGPGVPADQYQRIFDRFYRVGGDHHDSGIIGCGLGLAIVSHIASLHGANIAADHSSYATGLRITVNFPPLKEVDSTAS